MRTAVAVAALAAVLGLAGCGGGAGDQELKVSAAASLKQAFTAYEPHAHYSFAGSDQLAAQIRSGVRPDVYAAANTELPQDLHVHGLVERPIVFARNRLVLVARSQRIRSLADAARPGVKVAIGSPTVPAGKYARKVLAASGDDGRRVLRNVRSQEPDVAGVVGKVEQGAVDAGFVYATDARAARLRAIELPQSEASYAVAIVRRSNAARAFVRGLLEARGRRALLRAGFRLP
ncbi:MAG TPA: molybdate ABC transporter substrate-binding protein [Thermoleophilaceae bacterium]|nr:molybdate ABC transporter substrate-binding protein [Thermoleophilaceae bacterium]